MLLSLMDEKHSVTDLQQCINYRPHYFLLLEKVDHYILK